MLPGGKGINVSRILNQFEVPNIALGFVGGFSGDFIREWLEKEGSSTQFIEISSPTRINVKTKGTNETEINGAGPVIDEEAINQLRQQIQMMTSEDLIVLSGSKAQGLPEDFYLSLISLLKERGIPFIFDTASQELIKALPMAPLLVKPNQDELGDLFGVEINSLDDVVLYGKKLQELGAENVVVSLGGDGALFIDKERIVKADAPQGKVINTVGSGDSMIAGFVAGLQQGLPASQAFVLAVQSGSATAFKEDLAEKEDIDALNGAVGLSFLHK
jgi:1-phosphofructokinase